jgi:IS30 family transposase
MNGRTTWTHGYPWTEDAVEQLRQLAQHELSAREIAKRMGRSQQAIKRQGRQLGLTIR